MVYTNDQVKITKSARNGRYNIWINGTLVGHVERYPIDDGTLRWSSHVSGVIQPIERMIAAGAPTRKEAVSDLIRWLNAREIIVPRNLGAKPQLATVSP